MTRKVGGREATTGVIPGRYCLSVGKPDLPSPEGWAWRPLLEMARLESGHTPSRRKPEYWGGDVSWIGIKDATGSHGQTIAETIQHTNELGIANSAARVLPANTVCLSRTASVGSVVVMGKPMATSQDFANWVCGPDLDYRFLKYALLVENEALRRFSYGSTHKTIYYPELKAFYIRVPNRGQQEEIADALQALDDKIELNRKTAATLEEMTRALYRSWFVDFDPVHTKAEGRAPNYMDAQAAALFPDSIGDNNLPEGWRKVALSEVFEPKNERAGSEQIREFSSSNQGIHPRDEKYKKQLSKDTSKNKVASRGDFVFGLSRKVLNFGMMQEEIGAFSPAYRVYSVSRGGDFSSFVYEYMKSFPDYFYQAVSASSREGQAISEKSLLSLDILEPPQNVLDAFSNATAPWIEMSASLLTQSQTLANLRDTLLPRLMSGELRVGEAKEQVEAVA